MGVASALGKFAGKAALKIGGGAAVGAAAGAPAAGVGAVPGAIGGGLLGTIALTADIVPLLTDLFSGGEEPDPAKIAEITKARDGMAARLAAAEGIPLSKALEAVNEQMKPLIDQASQKSPGVGTGKTLTDAGALGLTAGLVLHNRKLGRGLKSTGAAKPIGEDGVKDAELMPKQAPMGLPYEPDLSRGKNRAVQGMGRDAIAVPPDGGTMPDPEMAALRELMIAARMKGKRPPGAYQDPQMALPMGPETGRRLDEGRMRSRMYAGEGD